MSVIKTTPREPAPAERVRTILATAGSLGVTASGAREDIMTGVTAEFDGALRLTVPADCRTAGEVLCAPRAGLPALLEWTDLAPVPVRGRVRAHVRVVARLTIPDDGPADAVRLLADVRQIALAVPGRVPHFIEPGALLAAAPDPVATAEARMLLHLADGHRAHVDALARQLDPRRLRGVTRVTPLALDRYGLVLRLASAHHHRDVRLPFPHPLSTSADLAPHLHTLLTHRP